MLFNNNDSLAKFVSLKKIKGFNSSLDKLKVKMVEKSKFKQKRISNEIRKFNKKCRMNEKPVNDLFTKFKVVFSLF